MPGTGAKFAARFNLAALREMAPNVAKVFVIDLVDVVSAKRANLATWRVSSTAAARSSSTRTVAALATIGAKRWATALSPCAKTLARSLAFSRWSLVICHSLNIPRRTLRH
jgi:hypothetical protein